METLEEHDTKITRALPSMDELLKRAETKGRIEAFKECLKHFDFPHNFQHEKSHIVWQMQEYTKGVDWLYEQIGEKNE